MKVLINSGRVINVFFKRQKLIDSIKENGHSVTICGYELEGKPRCDKEGVGFEYIPFSRASINPIRDIKVIWDYYCIIKKGRYDVVHSYTAKPNIYGSIGARLAGVKRIYPTINGLGYAFTGNSLKNRIVRLVTTALYKIAFDCSTVVFFQNPDDAEEMVRRHTIKRDKCIVIAGSGIDLEEYPFSYNLNSNVFFMATRLLKTKGIMEYLYAARDIKKKYSDTRFLLAGAIDPNPDGISLESLKEYINDGTVEYLGQIDNMAEMLAQASVFVLPSYYREGVPHAVLEAMSVGRAIITTDMPGCRETIKNADSKGKGDNGFLIQPRSVMELTEKIIWMIEHPEHVVEMGKKSRSFAEERFDVRIVNEQMLEAMQLI